jgi:hypothetical protein
MMSDGCTVGLSISYEYPSFRVLKNYPEKGGLVGRDFHGLFAEVSVDRHQ